MKMLRLKKRHEFLSLSRSGFRWSCASFVLQYLPRDHEGFLCRFGFTATRNLGNSVRRNRARRRLKAAISVLLQENFTFSSGDYVVIARHGIFHEPLPSLSSSLKKGMNRFCSSLSS